MTKKKNSPTLNQDFADEESGMFAFQISLIGADGWPISLEQQVQHSSLFQFPVLLRHRQSFRVKIRAQNYAGLEVTVISATQVVTDATPPVLSHVSDFGLGEYELDLLRAVAAAWPIGYRLEEKCDVVGVICVAPFQDVRRGRFIPPESSSKASLIQHSQHFGKKAAFNPRRRAVLNATSS